jgi:hypothetical protein
MFFGQRAYGVAAAAQVYSARRSRTSMLPKPRRLPGFCQPRRNTTRFAVLQTQKRAGLMYLNACSTSDTSITIPISEQ